tara:strand:- start:80 stop:232 length:153 start_codon:yes stop_codon:yes gene_type:complete
MRSGFAAFTASGSIASGSLLAKEIEKQVHCFFFPLEMMVHALATFPDTSP